MSARPGAATPGNASSHPVHLRFTDGAASSGEPAHDGDVRADDRTRGRGPADAGLATPTARPRLGLSVPHEWWPSAPLLKSYEAAGFAWVQLHSPPLSVLADRQADHRPCRRRRRGAGDHRR